MHNIYIALGSNLENPKEQIKNAILKIEKITDTLVLAQSSLYETAPVGLLDQPNFINAAIKVQSKQKPHDLLKELQKIEHKAGRVRIIKNEPRILDLDILLIDNLVFDTIKLTVPHPRMHKRLFVLIPLSEINQNIDIPGFGLITNIISTLPTQHVTRLKD